MKLYIEEAFALAKEGDIKGAFAELFKDFTGSAMSIDEFFAELIAYLRKSLGIEENL